MQTQISVAEKSAPKTALKVDNLIHISDHGLAVRFTEPKLARMVEFLNSKDGETNLFAGKSSLSISKIGSVTMTRFFRATSGAGYWIETIHYLDGALAYKISRQAGPQEKDAFDTLRGVIFGEHKISDHCEKTQILPPIWYPKCGADSDKLRNWLRDFAWTLTGISGLRAQAIKRATEALKSSVSSADRALIYSRKELANLDQESPESFRISHEASRELCAAEIKSAEEVLAGCEADRALALAGATENSDTLKEIALKYGCHRFTGAWLASRYEYTYSFPSVGVFYSHSPRSANYIATIGSDGDSISLSSGVECEFKRSEIIAWLRGDAQAPRTRYGVVERLDCSTHSGEAISLIKCGCHYIDASKVDAELAELLLPRHTVSVIAGKPKISFGEEGFRARLLENIDGKAQRAAQAREQALRSFAHKKHELNDREKDLPELKLQQIGRIQSAEEDLAKATRALADSPWLLGAGFECNEVAARAILNSQNLGLSL